MIKFENTEVVGWEHAIRGMRNPLNSWEKSDSEWKDIGKGIPYYEIGDNDHNLMMRLKNAGTDHRKYLRMITVYVDITAPLYWFKEWDTYKVGTVSNSCSTMHKLLSKPFEMSDFSFDHLSGYKNEVKQFAPELELDEELVAKEVWQHLDNNYDVSNYGRVKHNFANHYRIISGSLHQDGYRYVTLYGKQYPLHRIVAYIFHNYEYNRNLEVNHIDGNKQNNFADNLECVTSSENHKHALSNKLQPQGLSTYKGKLSEKEREIIKKMWDEGELSRREIAKMYGVSHTTICSIINDKYKYAEKTNVYEEIARPIVDNLNELRDSYLNCNDEETKKEIWYMIIQLLPSSYNQKRTVMMNYEVLSNIYKSRQGHKLDEWSKGFIDWIESLPYSELITGEVK